MPRAIRAHAARLTVLSALLLLSAATTDAQSQSSTGLSTITVHGHWTITVREPDGLGRKQYEFDNALIDAQPLLLTLARQRSAGYWSVILGDGHDVGGPCVGGTPPERRSCILQEPGDATAYTDSPPLHVLSVSLEGSPSPTKVVLQGTFTATAAAQISTVVTGLSSCANTVAPASPCAIGSFNSFTGHLMLPSGSPAAGGPIPVTAGQVVQVRVEISFESAPTT